jgi:hypothetical protein
LVENSYWHLFQRKSGETQCVKGRLCKFVFEAILYWQFFLRKIPRFPGLLKEAVLTGI